MIFSNVIEEFCDKLPFQITTMLNNKGTDVSGCEDHGSPYKSDKNDIVINGGPIEYTEEEKRALEGKCNCPRCWDGGN